LDDSQPKYLNSPQSEVFDKSRLLYAMNLARDGIRSEGAVIVEGYMDAIAAHQAGFHNVVASMGTALTEPQVNAIRRLTNRVTMALDQDTAGQQATLRSLESSWRIYQSRVAGRSGGTTMLQHQENPEIRIAAMPTGQDPDEVIRRSSGEWRALVADARPLLEFVITAMAASVDPSLPRGKAAIADQVSRLIFAVQDAPQQDHYFQMLAEKLGVPLDTLRASISRPAAPRRTRGAPTGQQPGAAPEQVTASPFASLDHDPIEEYCLALLMHFPELGETTDSLTADLFQRPENREIFSNYLVAETQTRNTGEDEEASAENVPPGVREQIDALRTKSLPAMDLAKRRWAIAENVANLEYRHLKQLKRDEEDRFADSPDDISEEDHKRAVELNQRIKENEDRRRSIRASR
jgi:DNA primase